MKLLIQTAKRSAKALAITTCCLVPFMGVAQASNTSHLALKTSAKEVNGVREIEAGNYAAGIRKSEAALARASASGLKAPLLTNLCVAHIATNHLEKAENYCNAAVKANARSPINFNNRAVLNCITGKSEACLVDLETAQSLSYNNRLVNRNLALVSKSQWVAKQ
ncbi:hypothetical protein [Alteromonas sp. a30]|uniref:hypothetical protein n=1 Tax=Alteromonas sp. a30 TaxID=2730917 RepID=UPI002281846F|nr:hypothetical protein [Alteromonas sp. a30]MCY7296736.1 hypothetical protein [Alteromonas sp. a30]